ncbi:MAG: DUF4097 family beta strand repeat-containing protein [Clostridia bacterium]|nr:DUF4097 family beta strand repeat-containing protein [Clostridia bacterium]
MKYINWHDELLGYLSDLNREEREKITSYFAEMYADKRDAGLSEEEIVESFGAPYDVAKRIRSENGLNTRPQSEPQKAADNALYGEPAKAAPTAYSQPAAYPPPAPAKSGVARRAIIIAATAILGAFFIAIAAIVISAAITANKIKFDTATFTAGTAVTSIDVSIAAGEAECVYSDEVEFLTVEYFNSDEFGYSTSMTDGKFTLSPTKRTGGLIWNIAMSIRGWDVPKITIKIPAAQKVDAEIKLSAGTFGLGDGEYGNVTLKLSAGKLTTGALVCENYTANVSAGELISSATCKVMTLKLSAGSITLGKCAAENCTAKLSAGSLEIGELTAPQLGVTVSAGSFQANVKGNQGDYTVLTDVSAGNCNLHSQVGTDSTKTINVNVSAGSAMINFI